MPKKIGKRGNGSPYLTKRILLSAAKSGVRQAAREAMELMGYTIIVQDGWVVKKFADGAIERLNRIALTDNTELRLD